MSDIKLKVGERVRNIRPNSGFKGECGTVVEVHSRDRRYSGCTHYRVKYDKGHEAHYLKERSSDSLERCSGAPEFYRLGVWNITHAAYKSVLTSMFYGADLKQALAASGCESENHLFLSELKRFMTERGDYREPKWYHDEFIVDWRTLSPAEVANMMKRLVEENRQPGAIHYSEPATVSRHVLKKVRRNVINGKTQDDYVRDHGHARGVTEFNSRCLGKSTGQVLWVIGSCMSNPGVAVKHSNTDHAIGAEAGNSYHLNRQFRTLLESYIKKLDLKGFSVGPETIAYNPIVTEETYVETK